MKKELLSMYAIPKIIINATTINLNAYCQYFIIDVDLKLCLHIEQKYFYL